MNLQYFYLQKMLEEAADAADNSFMETMEMELPFLVDSCCQRMVTTREWKKKASLILRVSSHAAFFICFERSDVFLLLEIPRLKLRYAKLWFWTCILYNISYIWICIYTKC